MLISRFLQDRRGAIAPMFAVALVPVVALTGAAVDYSRAGAIRADLQSALDATSLMLSKEKDVKTLTPAELKTKAEAYFNALFNRPELKGISLTPVYSNSGSTSTVSVSAAGAVDTMFMRVLSAAGSDFSKMNVATKSEVTWGIKKLELALALDNTGSMASNNKMTELKKAAKNLLDTLYKAAQSSGDIKVAVIPFATDVNVGPDKATASWVVWPTDAEWDEQYGTCKNKKNDDEFHGKKSTCVAARGTWTPVPKSNWNGCVADRDQQNDVLDTVPVSGSKATLFPVHQASNCPTSMLPLVDILSNWSSIDLINSLPLSTLGKKIDAMIPSGNTNVTIGLSWAWHALTANLPLPEGKAPAEDLDKVIILLTDGLNTENRFSTTTSEIDARTTMACANVKAANIKLYTVRVIDGNASLLQSCATNPSMYFDVQNASQLNAVFLQISQNLASLRISK